MRDAQYKDVVIVGNGPSAMTLSYILAGNQPWLAPGAAAHPDEYLDARIRAEVASAASPAESSESPQSAQSPQSESESAPLFDLDLESLATGVEGRSTHPLALLMDALCHPGADLGHEMPSMLQWRYDAATAKDHIVLGHGPPGGSWQAMDGNVLTISLASWMELPSLDFKTWEARAHKDASKVHEGLHEGRASVASVAQYYSDYVRLQGLSSYFRSGVKVTAVTPVSTGLSRDALVPKQRRHCWRAACCTEEGPLWRVDAVDVSTGSRLQYMTPHVVLATGGTDERNRLGVPGESLAADGGIVHDLRSLEEAVANIAKEAGTDGTAEVDPVLIVGAGLSAADAVIAAHFHSLPVLHVFRNRLVPANRQLPENMYPEYHKVHQMMGDGGANYPKYQALPEHHVVDLTGMHSPDHKVVIEGPDGERTAHRVSLVAILIGSRPNLTLLRSICGPGGTGLGIDPNAPIDCRSNPIEIDPWTHSVRRAPQSGLFALGPIAGDNFVRFVQGGALGVASWLSKKKR